MSAASRIFKWTQRPGHQAFLAALKNPREAQERRWQAIQREWSGTELGEHLQLARIKHLEDLRDLPPSDHTTYQERRWHTSALRFEPTSGSTAKRKLIPYTRSFLRELDHAVAPWVFDLYQRYPGIAQGKQYWALSWLPTEQRKERAGNSDADFLPWWKNIFAQRLFAVPQNLNLATSLEEHKWRTCLHLAGSADLSLISVWSPTFLLSLMDDMTTMRAELARALPHVTCLQGWDGLWTQEFARRLWPRLALISAWDAAYSAVWAERLKSFFPHVPFQGKGLWSTEGVVSIPLQGRYPLAITSHFYQFECQSSQRTLFVWELEDGMKVKPLLTCGNGFVKYRMDDLLVVDGFLSKTPCLVFIGRDRHVDMVGEKLDQSFVLDMFAQLRSQGANPVALFAQQHPKPHYELLMEGDAMSAEQAETQLRQSHHYQLARELGQLGPIEILAVPDGRAEYLRRMKARGILEGDIKIEPLSLA